MKVLIGDLNDELRAIDWDEAIAINELRDFEKQREAVVLRQMPVGTRVRWLQTPNREVFEAEGIVGSGAPSRWRLAITGAKPPCVWVKFTKHPALDAGHRVMGESFGAYIELANLERLD